MRAQLWIGLMIGGVLVVLAAAIAFGESDQAHRLAEHAEQLARSERVLSSISTTRSNLGISVVLNRTSDLDPSLSAGAAEAGNVTSEAAHRLVTATSDLDASAQDLDLSSHLTMLEALVVDLEDAGSESALEATALELVTALEQLESDVVSFRDVTASQVAAEGGRAGDLARVASYTVGLLAPAIALIAFRRLSQHRLERIRREGELRRREEIAAAKVDLVAGLSHELRTPLTGLHGFSYTLIDMLERPAEPDERPLLREIAGMLVEQTSDLARMVDDLISFMRLSDGTMSSKPVAVDVAAAVTTVTEEYAAHGPIPVTMEPALARCDPIHLRQIVRNLISNSTKHGGKSIEIRGLIEDGEYLITIADDGPGLDPDRGDPFAAFAHEGAAPLTAGSVGMGLGVVRGLAEVSNGSAGYRRVDGWTCIDVRIPLSRSEAAAAEDHVFAVDL